MRVKIFSDGTSYSRLEKKINQWLYQNTVQVIDIKYADYQSYVSAMIMYRDK